MWTIYTTSSCNFLQCDLYSYPFKCQVKSHLLALLGAHHILHVSRIRVSDMCVQEQIIVIQFNEVSIVDGLCSGVFVAVINGLNPFWGSLGRI